MSLRLVVAAIVGMIVFLLFEFLAWGILLRDFFGASRVEYAGLMKSPPDVVSLALFNLVWSSLLAYIFDKWAGIRTFAAGALAGAVFMMAVDLAINLRDLALFNLLKNPVVVIPVKLVVIAITGAIGGGLIAMVLAKMRARGKSPS